MRIMPKTLEDYPWYFRPLFLNQRRKFGKALDPVLLWARSPGLFIATALLFRMVDRKSSPLSPDLRSLVMVRVSQINWCAFCVDMNSATLKKRGVSLDKISALPEWRTSDLFIEKECVALEYTEAVTRSDSQVDDALMDRLKQYFDDDAVIELTGLIVVQNLSSKFNSALDVPPHGFCQITH